jgi:hypothetical protein
LVLADFSVFVKSTSKDGPWCSENVVISTVVERKVQ